MSSSDHEDPGWDMTPFFPEFDGTAYRAFRQALRADVARLQTEVAALPAIAASTCVPWADLLVELERAWSRSAHLASYLGCIGAANARDENIKRETASAAAARVELEKVFVAVRAALRDVDDDAFAALCAESRLGVVAHFLGRLREAAAKSMAPELEGLAAELGSDGLAAWGRLYDRISGNLVFTLERPEGAAEQLPVSMTRTLLEDADPRIRRAAFVGANAAWRSVGEITAACLNGIAGARLTLQHRRGIGHFLEPGLFDAAIGRPTLDAMQSAVRARVDVPRRYLRRKAAILGCERLGFHDRMAPLPLADVARVPFVSAREQVLDAFARFDPDLARFALQAFERRWIDWAPRAAKRPGGFCSTSYEIGESRVFITYNGAAGDVATLAHELGHAWHGWLMRDMRPWARRYPMTLAETASTFAESLVIDRVLSDPAVPIERRATMLDGRLQDAATYLLDIGMRFEFEASVYRERADGELPVSRLEALMLDAQRSWYGDALAEDGLDPLFWASKLHFYITGISFYNFPYTFGYLFSIGLIARAREEGAGFVPRYIALLRDTGSDTVERVAHRHLGVDLEAPDFWNASLDRIEADLGVFEGVADAVFAPAA